VAYFRTTYSAIACFYLLEVNGKRRQTRNAEENWAARDIGNLSDNILGFLIALVSFNYMATL